LFILKPHSDIPIYRQLVDQIRRMVLSGQLEAGTPLPSIRELAIRHAINPMTVSKAYSLLEAEGLLDRHRGKPMTVAERKHADGRPAAKLAALDPHLEQVVIAGRQLALDLENIIEALGAMWEREGSRNND